MPENKITNNPSTADLSWLSTFLITAQALMIVTVASTVMRFCDQFIIPLVV